MMYYLAMALLFIAGFLLFVRWAKRFREWE